MGQHHDPLDFLPDLPLPLGHWKGFGQRSVLTLLETLPPGMGVDPALAASMIQEALALLEQETLGMLSEVSSQ